MKFSDHLAEVLSREPGQRAPRRQLELQGPGDTPEVLHDSAAAVLDNRTLVYAPRWRLESSERRTTVGLNVTADAVLVVTHPAGITGTQLAGELRRAWRRITREMTAAEAALPERPVKELRAGEGFRWLGYPSRLDITREPAGPARRERDGFGWWLRLPGGPHLHSEPARDAITQFYVTEGTAWARKEAGRWLPRLSLAGHPPAIEAAYLDDGRWYEYRPRRHEVRLHWAVFQLDTELVRYLLVHALVHATRPEGAAHGPEFRRRLERVTYGWRDLERRLAEQARTLWTGAISEPRPRLTREENR